MPLSNSTDAEANRQYDDGKIASWERQARDLAQSLETVRRQTLSQSNARIEVLEQGQSDLGDTALLESTIPSC
jgi:polyhydroxyalkanoate synthesis regulator phasin